MAAWKVSCSSTIMLSCFQPSFSLQQMLSQCNARSCADIANMSRPARSPRNTKSEAAATKTSPDPRTSPPKAHLRRNQSPRKKQRRRTPALPARRRKRNPKPTAARRLLGRRARPRPPRKRRSHRRRARARVPVRPASAALLRKRRSLLRRRRRMGRSRGGGSARSVSFHVSLRRAIVPSSPAASTSLRPLNVLTLRSMRM